MRQEILNYLQTQKVGVLAVELPSGAPHAATVHFAHTEDPFTFYFETYSDSIKARALRERAVSRASFVVGSDPAHMKTLQIDGTVHLLTADEREIFERVYLEKFPEKKEKSQESKFIAFKFIPTWWRFTDWTAPGGKLILDQQTSCA